MDINFEKSVEELDSLGYTIIEEFLTADELKILKTEFERVVDEHVKQVECGKSQDYASLNYDINLVSGDELSFHIEDGALNDDGTLKENCSRNQAYARIGCSWHTHNEVFRKVLTNARMVQLLKALKFERPVHAFSEVHPKFPRIAADFWPHRDSWTTFTEPLSLTVALCISLDDSTKENGCLQVVPSSHLTVLPENIRKKAVRGEKEVVQPTDLDIIGDDLKFEEKDYIDVEVKQGGLLILHAHTYHRSQPNLSDKPRVMLIVDSFDYAKAKLDKKGFHYNNGPMLLVLENQIIRRNE